MNLNSVHLHLLLNHFPTVGNIVALGLLLFSLVWRNGDLKRFSFGVFFVIGLLTLPVYLTGSAAQTAIEGLPDVPGATITAHQDAAVLAFLSMEIAGVLAWFGLWQFRRNSRLAGWNVSAVLLLSIVTLALMARTATIGGEIRHPEIRPGQEATLTEGATEGATQAGTAAVTDRTGSEGVWLKSASIRSFVIDVSWVWSASETLHFIGMTTLMGVILVANLRILGMIKGVSFAALHQLLPVAIFGFALNASSGMLFFIALSNQYTPNPSFFWKMAFIFLAGVHLLYLTVFDGIWAVGPGDDAPLTAKVVAASGLFVWFGVIFWGSMLPFLGLRF